MEWIWKKKLDEEGEPYWAGTTRTSGGGVSIGCIWLSGGHDGQYITGNGRFDTLAEAKTEQEKYWVNL